MERRLKLGVRELIEFCCRGGDLGYDASPGISALDGQQIHQRIQQKYADTAQAEVTLQYETELDGYQIQLGGRIDLLFADETLPRIEEIKTVYRYQSDDAQDDLPWAQLKCYAACYAEQQELDEVMLSLNLVNLFSEREHRHRQPWRRSDLREFLQTTLRQYLHWHVRLIQRREALLQQAREFEFPFTEFRPQQRQFAAAVYRNIRDQQQLIVEAPTGSGKTISTLFPAVKAIGEDLCDQIVYLSAKVSGQQQAVAAIEMMPTALSYLVIQAKARSCPCQGNPEETDADGRCLRCIGFFDRLPAARQALFDQGHCDVATIQRVAGEHRLCPFELGLQMLRWVDVVICDFNYVFDPLVQLGYFKEDQRRKLLLIDELHNLVDRARGMYSASLTRAQIKQADAAGNSPKVSQVLRKMLKTLDQELRVQLDDEEISEKLPMTMLQACQKFSEKLGFDIFANKHIAVETLEFSKQVFRFQRIGLLYARHHRTLGYKPVRSREVKLMCLNAFEYLHDCYPMFESVCGFSATLSPAEYFRDALGFADDTAYLRLGAVFPPENLGVCVADYVDLRYRERDRHVDAVCASIANCYLAHPGNYLVFFSAYRFMFQVHERFAELYPQIDTLLQQREFDSDAQARFLARFFEDQQQLGFAIMGGRFAEGIDYRGDALIGAIIVGVGLPQANSEQQLIQQDYADMQLDGFDYAFRYPGLIRVLQSAGRVIRDRTDRGVIVLLDRRFRQPDYQRHLPAHWQLQYCNQPESLEQSLLAFWGDQDGGNQD